MKWSELNMRIPVFILMVLFVCLLQFQHSAAQVIYRGEAISAVKAFKPGQKLSLAYPTSAGYSRSTRNRQLQKPDYRLQLNHYSKYSPPSTFTLRNVPMPEDWLYEHNLVTVRSIMAIVNWLNIGINCHYNWAFALAGNGLGMVLNKAPVKISFAAVVGGAPNLCHR